MKRRLFNSVLGTSALGTWTVGALAQGGPIEGTHFQRLKQPAPVAAREGKIEVVEFFWYGCPACNALEPTLVRWTKTLKPDIVFRRIPVAFGAIHESHQRLFFALEAMGQLEALHERVFAAIHNGQQRLDKEVDQVAFARAQGLDPAKFSEVLKSFSVQTRARQARQLAESYRIEGVPTLGVHGKFVTSVAMAGDAARALAVVDFLVAQVRRG